MAYSVKKVIFLIFFLIPAVLLVSELNAQNGRTVTGSGIEKSGSGVTGPGSDETDNDLDADTDIGNDPEDQEEISGSGNSVKKQKKMSEPKEKTGIAGLSKETLLERETKRHENQMKQISAIRRKAKDMLKKADEMEAKELRRHDESVTEIKDN